MRNVLEFGGPKLDQWYGLTDEYAAALEAMQRGDVDGRERVIEAYEKLRNLTAPNDAGLRRA